MIAEWIPCGYACSGCQQKMYWAPVFSSFDSPLDCSTSSARLLTLDQCRGQVDAPKNNLHGVGGVLRRGKSRRDQPGHWRTRSLENRPEARRRRRRLGDTALKRTVSSPNMHAHTIRAAGGRGFPGIADLQRRGPHTLAHALSNTPPPTPTPLLLPTSAKPEQHSRARQSVPDGVSSGPGLCGRSAAVTECRPSNRT